MLNNIVNRYLTKLARITEGKVFIEGYRSMWPASKDAFAYINVSGNTFPIKDELVRAGLRWNPNSKSWGLSVSSQGDGFRQYDRIAPKIDKAFDVLEPLVQKFNAEVDQRNKALSPQNPQGLQEVLRYLDSLQRRAKFLQQAGLELRSTQKNPNGVPELTLYISGNTYPFLDLFKRFGWKWAATQKAWWIPFDDWKMIEAKFLAAIAPMVARMAPAPQGSAPVTFPWSKGKVWLRNTEIEDEAEESGVLFIPAGPQQVLVQRTHLSKDYERPPERMRNEDALKLWERLTARNVYVPG